VPASCNGCGACCRPVSLPFTPFEVYAHPERFHPEDWRFILEDLDVITRREAFEIHPWLKDAGLLQSDINGELSAISTYYLCRWHDVETGRCTNHENRPPLCREYPWATPTPREKDFQLQLPPTCAYREDLGKSVEPVPVAFRQKKAVDYRLEAARTADSSGSESTESSSRS
jgi:Fe-S-cluster containining protein